MATDNFIHALAGAGGGILSLATTYPLVTISTSLQVKKEEKLGWRAQWNAAKRIVEQSGIVGLYSGMDAALLGNAVTNGLYYYFYEMSKKLINNDSHLSTGESMLAGMIAGSCTAFFSNPIWIVMTRKISQADKKKGEVQPSTLDIVRQVWNEDGPRGFLRGLLPALILVTNPIIQYTVFEQVKQQLEKSRVLSSWDFFWLGAFSKLIATGTTYPYITLKSRLQVAKDGSGMMNVAKEMVQKDGVGSFYRGIESKLLQSILTAAILFATKEMLYSYTVKLLQLTGSTLKDEL